MCWETPACNTTSDSYNTPILVLSIWFIAAYFTSDREASFQQLAYSQRFCPYINVDDGRYFKKGNCGNSTPILFLLKKGGMDSVSHKEPELAKCHMQKW
jgi:hypothetical protein